MPTFPSQCGSWFLFSLPFGMSRRAPEVTLGMTLKSFLLAATLLVRLQTVEVTISIVSVCCWKETEFLICPILPTQGPLFIITTEDTVPPVFVKFYSCLVLSLWRRWSFYILHKALIKIKSTLLPTKSYLRNWKLLLVSFLHSCHWEITVRTTSLFIYEDMSLFVI